MNTGSGRPSTLDTRISCCFLCTHSLGVGYKKTLLKNLEGPGCFCSGWEVHGKRLTWKCHSFTQTGSCGHQRMCPEREYCYTYQRSVPHDRDTTSDSRHRESDRGIVHRLNAKEEQCLNRGCCDKNTTN
jgi:hypothetical protein